MVVVEVPVVLEPVARDRRSEQVLVQVAAAAGIHPVFELGVATVVAVVADS